MNGRHGDNPTIIQLDRIIAAMLEKRFIGHTVWYTNKEYNFLQHSLYNYMIHQSHTSKFVV